ncbi:MAG TPA: UDP-N-acetylmuramate dehydrogenase [Thermomicrobiales bacterium]|nr:UDP-N-acetylmuramate dehydrogenase [Thermomicrobiales bacterium]
MCYILSMQRLLDLPNLQRDVPLAPLTTYRIGGPADWFVAVRNADELVEAVTAARREEIPYFLLGTGANILVGDLGFRGLVIHNRADHSAVNGTSVTAESGTVIADLIDKTARAGLSGLEHFAGIPSSVGGAVWQNLHFLAPDRVRTLFIEEVIQSAEILDEDGRRRIVDRDFFQFGYDDSILHHRPIVVLSVVFQLTPGLPDAIRHQARENLAWRAARQPPVDQFPSCGSVFKKIEGVGAGRLIDQAGLKGRQIGGAQISPKHANFIVNRGGATAQDVLALAGLAQAEVRRETGYALEMEIGLVGEFVAPAEDRSRVVLRAD